MRKAHKLIAGRLKNGLYRHGQFTCEAIEGRVLIWELMKEMRAFALALRAGGIGGELPTFNASVTGAGAPMPQA